MATSKKLSGERAVATVYRRSWHRPIDFVRAGIFFGLLSGITEVVLRSVAAEFGLRFQPNVGPEMIWMIPLAGLLVFGALGLLIAVVAAFWRGDGLDRVAFAAFVAVGTYALLLYWPGLHTVARILLSLGIAVELSRVLARNRNVISRFALHAIWPAMFVVFLTAFGFRVNDAVTERRALANLPAPPANAPNVLLIVLDAVRAADLGVYGYARPTTPNLQRFAPSGVVFERAVSTAPWTLPSHGSLFTGHYPHELSGDWTARLDNTYKTLAELLRDRGYATAGVVANTNYARSVFGLGRGFIHYEFQYYSPLQVLVSSRLGQAIEVGTMKLMQSYHKVGRSDAADVNRRLLGWLPKRGSRPFFVFLNYFDAHAPYAPPPPYDLKFSITEPPTRDIRNKPRKNSAVELRGMQDAYDGSIAYIDEQVGALFREMQRRGLLSNTLVIITSDHGEEFGEHEWVGHGNGLHFPSLHVPLLISFPGRVPRGVRVPDFVTLRDVPATVVHLLGIEKTVGMPGRSLALHWGAPVNDSAGASPILSELNPPARVPDRYAVAKGPMRSIVAGRYHYIRNGDGREELYDILADPWERTDLALSRSNSKFLQAARSQLDAALRIGLPAAVPDR